MKKFSRLLSILILALMTATPFMSLATEEAPLAATGNVSEVTEDVTNGPTEVVTVDNVLDLSKESDAEYDNDAFFTIDASESNTSADLATEEVSGNVSDILSGTGSTSEKQSEIIDTLEDSGLYHAEESGSSNVDVTSKFAYQRLRLTAEQGSEINAYGASKAVYYDGSYQLSYDSMEATKQAYDALVSEYGKEAVIIDTPVRVSSDEKGWGTSYMRMDYQKTLPENGGAVTVAVIDTGIKKDHPVFSGTTILDGKNFTNSNSDDVNDENGHGTAVSGVIAESTPANVKILPLKALGADSTGSLLNVLNAVQYADQQGADIINLSISAYLYDTEKERCDNVFKDCSALIVGAAGNDSKNLDEEGVTAFPGEIDSAVCVGSITNMKQHTANSNYGSALDFSAPGTNVMAASLNGSYANDSGTSYSSAYLASAAAIVKAGHAEYSNEQILKHLESISEDLGDPGKDVLFGAGCPMFLPAPDKQPDNGSAQKTDTKAAADGTGYQGDSSNDSGKKSVKTGDEQDLTVWVALMTLSSLAIAGLVIRRKKTQ
ncbi:MAG: S8 family serine peptidase [Oscillospiraceae bacterium]|nr:S8 family serine peptidase [Oscillospiraceae bacterium]